MAQSILIVKYSLPLSIGEIFRKLAEKKPIDYIVFADTGNEHPETYYFVDNYMKPFLESENIPFITVYPYKKRSLYTRCFERKVIPDMLRRWCTRDVKVKPIHKFYKTLNAKIIQYIGIDYQESHRIKHNKKNLTALRRAILYYHFLEYKRS